MRVSDADGLFEVFSNPDAMKYWSTLPYTELAQMEGHIGETIEADPQTNLEFAVEYQGRVIGKAGFWKIPEIGYILHPDHWRKGFGAEILQALIAYGFEERGFDHIFADVDPENVASIKLLKRMGFEETGRAKNTIEIGGTWFDSVYFRLRNGADA
jgi:RimJ/RimL family protein N-acetyltransferase